MPIEFRCPHCGQLLAVPDEAAGTTGTCRFCGATIVAPAGVDQPPELLQPGNPQMAPWGTPEANHPTGLTDAGAIVSEAWRILTRQWGLILASYFIVILIGAIVMMPFFAPAIIAGIRTGAPPGPDAFGVTSILAISLAGILLAPLSAGPLYVVDRLLARGEENIGAVFLGFRHYRALVLYALFMSVPGTLLNLLQVQMDRSAPGSGAFVSLLSMAVSFTLFILLQVGQMEIVDRGAEPLDALRISLDATRGYRLMMLLTWILLILCTLAGYVACCVGIFFTIGFVPLGQVLIYRQLRGLQGTVD